MELGDCGEQTRVSVVQAAELVRMHPAHFRRLCRQGVFPNAKKTAKGRPYYDNELLAAVSRIQKSGIGANGEEVCFYRRRKAGGRSSQGPYAKSAPDPDPYLKQLAQALRLLGVPVELLRLRQLTSEFDAEFGAARPKLAAAIPVIARRLLK